MSQVIGWLILKAIVRLIYNKVKPGSKKPGMIVSAICKLNSMLNLAFYSELMMAVHMDLLMAVLTNMRSFWINPFSIFFNSVLSLGILLFYIVMI